MSFFDYFQVASVALFVLIILAKTLYLRLNRKINPIAVGGGKKGLVLAVELVSLAALLAWMVEIVLYGSGSEFRIFPWPFDIPLLESQVAKVFGVVIITLGFVLFILAYVSFGDSWRVGFDVETPGPLVTTGVFSVSRNPIYLFLDLWFIGISLVNGTLIFLVLAALALVVQHWQILQEEAFLSHLYGQPYQDYCGRTGRYITWRQDSSAQIRKPNLC